MTALDFRTRFDALRARPGEAVTPAVVLVITALLVLLPAERSGWDWAGVARFLTFFASFVMIYAILALGLNVHWGYTGILNFGVMAFFLVGAYTGAVFVKDPATGEFSNYVGGFGERLSFLPFLNSDVWLPFLIGLLAAAFFSGVLAFLLSIPALRLREDYLAIATIGIAELVRRITIEERDFLNGSRGLTAIPRPFDLGGPSDWKFLLLLAIMLVLIFFLIERAIRSPWGRVLRAVREDELTVAASGKSVFGFKSQSFVVGAMIMGMGGALYAFANGAVSPDTFSHFFGTFLFWIMLMAGGSGNNKGAILGAYIIWGFWQVMFQIQAYDLPGVIEVRISFIRDFILGSLIAFLLLLRPQGLLREERRVSVFLPRGARPPPPEERAAEAAGGG